MMTRAMIIVAALFGLGLALNSSGQEPQPPKLQSLEPQNKKEDGKKDQGGLKPLLPLDGKKDDPKEDKGPRPLEPEDKKDQKKDDTQKPKIDPDLVKPLEPNKQTPPKQGTTGGQGETPKDIMARIAKNMEASEDKLAKKETKEDTFKIQKSILDDLDKLIKQSEQQNQQNQQNQNSSSSSQQQQQKKSQSQQQKSQSQQQKSQSQQQKNNSQQQPMGGKQPMPQSPMDKKNGEKQQPKGMEPKNQDGKDGKDQRDKKDPGQKGKDASGKEKNNKGADGNGQKKDDTDDLKKDNTVADLFRDVWGHLPKTRRMEMDAYSRLRFMPKYDQVLRQYYRTIAERARRMEKE